MTDVPGSVDGELEERLAEVIEELGELQLAYEAAAEKNEALEGLVDILRTEIQRLKALQKEPVRWRVLVAHSLAGVSMFLNLAQAPLTAAGLHDMLANKQGAIERKVDDLRKACNREIARETGDLPDLGRPRDFDPAEPRPSGGVDLGPLEARIGGAPAPTPSAASRHLEDGAAAADSLQRPPPSRNLEDGAASADSLVRNVTGADVSTSSDHGSVEEIPAFRLMPDQWVEQPDGSFEIVVPYDLATRGRPTVSVWRFDDRGRQELVTTDVFDNGAGSVTVGVGRRPTEPLEVRLR